MNIVLDMLLLILALPATLASLYVAVLTSLSAALPSASSLTRRLRFDVVVPAHNEELVVARCVASLRAMHWPSELFRIWVVADNCEDSTAETARNAGARVLVRSNRDLRGKGHALAFAFRSRERQAWADAVVVVDADTEVSLNLLEAYASRIEGGAHAVQACYGILNPRASWRTSLLTIAKASFHIVRSRARERMGLSCGIRGNGWCVTAEALRLVPFQAYSLAEDLEYGIELGLAGYRVHYADEAHADADMATTGDIAGLQRQRWEYGRFDLVRTRTLPLLRAAIGRRSAVCLDLALDLMVLPLSYVALNVAVLLATALLAAQFSAASPLWQGLGAACATSLVLYMLRGWQLSGLGHHGLSALARIPQFIAWKLRLMLRRRGSREWISTKRT